MNGHSPAPWHAFPVVGGWAISEDKLQAPVAKVYAEREARLIAAAPEMAEALAWILMDAGMLVDALRHPTLAPLTGRQIDGIAARIKAARTTYNKARGGA